MVTMGFSKEEITDSVSSQKYDEVMATYLLLGRKPPEVGAQCPFSTYVCRIGLFSLQFVYFRDGTAGHSGYLSVYKDFYMQNK